MFLRFRAVISGNVAFLVFSRAAPGLPATTNNLADALECAHQHGKKPAAQLSQLNPLRQPPEQCYGLMLLKQLEVTAYGTMGDGELRPILNLQRRIDLVRNMRCLHQVTWWSLAT